MFYWALRMPSSHRCNIKLSIWRRLGLRLALCCSSRCVVAHCAARTAQRLRLRAPTPVCTTHHTACQPGGPPSHCSCMSICLHFFDFLYIPACRRPGRQVPQQGAGERGQALQGPCHQHRPGRHRQGVVCCAARCRCFASCVARFVVRCRGWVTASLAAWPPTPA